MVRAVASAPEAIEQSVYFVAQEHKRELLRHVLGDRAVTRAIVFTRTKHGADRVARQLSQGEIHAEAIHGDKAQSTRLRALSRFRDGQLRVLVATDLASRGIDVSGVSHVINYDLPMDPEAYVQHGEELPEPTMVERPAMTSDAAPTIAAKSAQERAKDPICGMVVDKATALTSERAGRTYYFCSVGCLRTFESPEAELKAMRTRVTIAFGKDRVVPV